MCIVEKNKQSVMENSMNYESDMWCVRVNVNAEWSMWLWGACVHDKAAPATLTNQTFFLPYS
jgi:hypothetical protein